MGMEVRSEKSICFRCGTAFTRYRSFFPVSYAVMHKGVGHVPICKGCVDTVYATYLAQCNDTRTAVRQTCRKLDLYWSDKVFNAVEKKSSTRSIISQYMAKVATNTYAGKSYDDTLLEEGTLWDFPGTDTSKIDASLDESATSLDESVGDEPAIETPKEVIEFWGSGYTDEMYRELEQRRKYYYSRLPDGDEVDVGSEILIRQICNLEVTISRDSAAGRSIDKSVNSLNTLLGSLNLKPAQKKNESLEAEITSTPLGVWTHKFENMRPIPQYDKPNKIKKYVFTWMGHLTKLVGIKNGYTKLYDDEIERLRVDKPEYDDMDDEDLLINAYSEPDAEGGDADGQV